MAKKQKTIRRKIYQVCFYGAMEERLNTTVFVNRDDAILNMISAKDDFIMNSFVNGEIRVQKEHHDLDCYLVCIDVFVDNDHKLRIQLQPLTLIGDLK